MKRKKGEEENAAVVAKMWINEEKDRRVEERVMWNAGERQRKINERKAKGGDDGFRRRGGGKDEEGEKEIGKTGKESLRIEEENKEEK